MFRILALDQASKNTGWCLINKDGVEGYGLISVEGDTAPLLRLKNMFFKIYDLIKETNPSFVVFEGTQYQNNAGTFSVLSKLQGLIMAILFLKNIGFFIVEPTCWKAFCKITGRRREEQKLNTKKFVADKYGLILSEDEADAVGIATWAINNILEDGNVKSKSHVS